MRKARSYCAILCHKALLLHYVTFIGPHTPAKLDSLHAVRWY